MKKRIVICCDGTWNKPESTKVEKNNPTNVLKLVRALCPVDEHRVNQIVFYDLGVGTGGAYDRYVGGATGYGLSQNILDAYRFLANNYNAEQQDEIWLFGFSRGAYTARSLCGLVHLVGILPKNELHKLPAAYEYYHTAPEEREQETEVNAMTRAVMRPPPEIEFLGVWDTVGSLGAPTPMLGTLTRKLWVRFHDTELCPTVRNAYQALAIDELRGPFKPAPWTSLRKGQQVAQVWFSGAHSNIGGGYPDTGLSDIGLLWMVDQARRCGLAFSSDYLDNPQLVSPNPAGKLYDSRSMTYKVLRKYSRPIGPGQLDPEVKKASVNEYIHPTAMMRLEDPAGNYRPDNLVKAIADGIPVWED